MSNEPLDHATSLRRSFRKTLLLLLMLLLASGAAYPLLAGEMMVDLSRQVVEDEQGQARLVVRILGAESLRSFVDVNDIQFIFVAENESPETSAKQRPHPESIPDTKPMAEMLPDVKILIEPLDGAGSFGLQLGPSFEKLTTGVELLSCVYKSAKVLGCGGTSCSATFKHSHFSNCTDPHTLGTWNCYTCAYAYDCYPDHYITGVKISGCGTPYFSTSCYGQYC